MDEQVGTVYTLKGGWQERSPKPYRHSIQTNCLVPCKCSIYIYIASVSRVLGKTSDGEVIDPVKA